MFSKLKEYLEHSKSHAMHHIASFNKIDVSENTISWIKPEQTGPYWISQATHWPTSNDSIRRLPARESPIFSSANHISLPPLPTRMRAPPPGGIL